MAKGWRKYTDYNLEAFGTLTKEARNLLRAKEPKGSTKWSLDYVAKESGIEHEPNRGTIFKVEAGTRSLSPEARNTLLNFFIAALDASSIDQNKRQSLKNQFAMFRVEVNQRPSKEIFFEDYSFNATYSLVHSWGILLHQGVGAGVLQEAQSFYDSLVNLPWLNTDIGSTLCAARVVQVLGYAQELFLPAKQWERAAIATYSDAERRIFQPSLKRFVANPTIAREYAKLLAGRSTMFRMIGQFGKSLADMECALKYAKLADDSILVLDLYLRYAHICATLGVEKQWQKTFYQAHKWIESHQKADRSQLLAYLDFYQGEGHKRLAFNLFSSMPISERQKHAQQGQFMLSSARKRLEGEWQWLINHTRGYHPLYVQVGETLCGAFITPKEMIVEIERLKLQATASYPALLGKTALVSRYIKDVLQRKQHNPLPELDLDGMLSMQETDALAIRNHLQSGM